MFVLAQSPHSGAKRLFENGTSSPTHLDGQHAAACKRARWLGSPAGRSNHHQHFGGVHPATISALKALFPQMDDQTVSNVLLECGNDIDGAIKKLTELRLTNDQRQQQQQAAVAAVSSNGHATANGVSHHTQQPAQPAHPQLHQQQHAAAEQQPAAPSGPQTADEWTDALVQEMAAARDVPDAKARAAKVLHAFEQFVAGATKTLLQRGGGAAAANAQPLPAEVAPLQARLEEVLRENAILKRAVQIQNARMQDAAGREGEVTALKQLVGQYQERLRSLELSNYSLALHLQKATDGSGAAHAGQRPPDVF